MKIKAICKYNHFCDYLNILQLCIGYPSGKYNQNMHTTQLEFWVVYKLVASLKAFIQHHNIF